MDHRRIAIVGKSGSGKSTVAKELSDILSLPHIELDGIHLQAHWTQMPRDKMRLAVSTALDSHPPGWIADGNYLWMRDVVWSRADTLVWLDYPLHVALWRLLKRTWTRCFGAEGERELWNGNRESVWHHLRAGWTTNLFAWCCQVHWRLRREVPPLLEGVEFGELEVLRFRSVGETERWLECLRKEKKGV